MGDILLNGIYMMALMVVILGWNRKTGLDGMRTVRWWVCPFLRKSKVRLKTRTIS